MGQKIGVMLVFPSPRSPFQILTSPGTTPAAAPPPPHLRSHNSATTWSLASYDAEGQLSGKQSLPQHSRIHRTLLEFNQVTSGSISIEKLGVLYALFLR